MNINLKKIPFSMRGSYMAISDLPEDYRNSANKEGIHLRTIRGGALSTVICRFLPMSGNEILDYKCCAAPDEIVLKTLYGNICICYADEKTLLITTENVKNRKNAAPELCLEFIPALPCFDYIYKIPCQNEERYLVNCFGQNVKYLIWAQNGEAVMSQTWDGCVAGENKIVLRGNENGLLAVIREIATEWDGICVSYDYESAHENIKKQLAEFRSMMPSVPERYEEVAKVASYVDWSSVVAADGFLTRDAMYMSKNWMCNIWSWDHVFNAIALAYHNPKDAWDQLMLLFDFQDPTGRIPDSVNNFRVDWNYCKPPVHGWALSRMMQVMELTSEQMAEAYDKIGKWTDWWLNYRDYDRDGLCEYTHGYDSGWDNATAFHQNAVVASPDLQTYLILQMETLADLAEKLGRKDGAAMWREKAKKMLEIMLEHSFMDGKPVILESGTHKIVPSETLLAYIPVMLGERLPKEIRDNLTDTLKSNKFLTKHGFATESPASPAYQENGYWLGPIWAPSTLLLLDGLQACGESELVKKVSEAFCQMIAENGYSENFNALTGEGLRDHAYTWTPSVFLIVAHDFLNEK